MRWPEYLAAYFNDTHLLSPTQRQQLLAAKSQRKCLHELFEQQASLTPHALAVVHRGDSYIC